MKRVLLLSMLLMSMSVVGFSQCGDPEPCTECGESPDCILCDIGVLDGYCYTLPAENQAAPLVGCAMNVFNNDRWFGFIASGNFIEIEITATNCLGLNGNFGVHGGLYGSCIGDVVDVQCNCVLGSFTLQGATSLGQTYWIGLDGCSGDICDISVAVIRGAGGFTLDDPERIEGLTQDDDPLEICWGYQGYTFTVDNVFGAQQYEWILPDGQVIIQDGNISPPVDFNEIGTFLVCAKALHACDTSEQTCINVTTIPLPPDSLYRELCESDPCIPFDDGGCYRESGFYDIALRDANGCFFDRTLELLAILENDTFLYVVICEQDAPHDLPDGSAAFDPGPYNTTIQNAFGCDSFIVTELAILDAEASIGDILCEDGVFTILGVLDRNPYATDFTAEWKDSEGNVVADSLVLAVTENGRYRLCTTISAYDVDDEFTVTCRLPDLFIDIADSLLLPQPVDSLFGPTVFCEVGIQGYRVDSVSGTEEYVWTVPPGAVILDGDGTDSITLDLTSASSGQLCVQLLNGCGLGIPGCRDLLIVDNLMADAGSDSIFCGFTGSLNATLQGNAGVWTYLSGPGSATISDSSRASTSITVSDLGSYELMWLDSAGSCNDRDTVEISFREAPSFTDLVVSICDSLGESYIVEATVMGGTSPYSTDLPWRVTADGMVTSGAMSSGDSFRVEIYDALGCGPALLEGVVSCDCLTSAGTMGRDTLQVCIDDSAMGTYSTAGEFIDPNDTAYYILHTIPGDSLGLVLASNDVPIFSYDSSLLFIDSTYYISRVVTDLDSTGAIDTLSACLSVSPGQPVIWRAIPAADAGGDEDLCQFTHQLSATPSVGDGMWSVVSGTGDVFFSDDTDPRAVIDLIEYGMYTIIWTEDNYGCIDTDTVTFDYRDVPRFDTSSIVYSCNPSNTEFAFSIGILGGDETSIEVMGAAGSLDGLTYETSNVLSGDTIVLSVYDQYACDTTVLVLTHDCPCISTAGAWDIATLDLCEDEISTPPYNSSTQVLDGNDVVSFILVSDSMDLNGSLLAESSEASFTFDPLTMAYGEPYFIYAVVSDERSGGLADLSTPCIDYSDAHEVVWFQIPAPVLSVPVTEITCGADPVILSITSDIDAMLSYLWSSTEGLVVGDATNDRIEAGAPGWYYLQASNGPCSVLDSVLITSSQILPSIVLGDDQIISCSMPEVVISAAASSPSGLLSYSWVDADGQSISVDSVTVVSVPGIYTFTVSDAATDCEASASVRVSIDTTSPVIVFPTVESLTCSDRTAVISALGSSAGPNFTLQWLDDQDVIINQEDLTITVTRTGTYTLIVTNTVNGCSTRRSVDVMERGNTLTAAQLDVSEISCHQANDGRVSVVSVTGGALPLSYSYDGGETFTSSATADGLMPGSYDVVVRDAEGCTLLQRVELIEPDLLQVDIGPDIELLVGDDQEIVAQISPASAVISDVTWSGVTSIDCLTEDCESIRLRPQGSGVLLVEVTDERGCTAVDRLVVTVDVSRDIFVPNVFSPNSDGVNDLLSVYAQRNAERVLLFKVFDRWGNMVYDARDFRPNASDIGWDGTYKGEELNPGVFTYIVEVAFLDGLVKQESGNVTLVR